MISYAINFEKWITDNLHPERRTPKRIAFLKALAKRIIDVHQEFIVSHNQNKEKLSWNGQTILLQRYLELKFGEGIVIENANSTSGVQIEYEADNLTNPITFIAPEVTNPIAYVAGSGSLNSNFSVKVPAGLAFNENEMRAMINNYLINYKNYTIEII